jgi:3-oxoacyl-[acyl-carrier-protein] synthase-3
MGKIRGAITAIGGYVPETILSNKDLEKMVDTNDEWIRTRTGIEERRILKVNGKGSSFMAIKAANEAIAKRGIDPAEIDMVICSTATPDMPVAINASYIATQVGAVNAFGFDLMAACSGFLFAVSVADKYIQSGSYKKILVIGTDKMSSIVDYTDRTTCVIFGDGAGVAIMEPSEEFGVQDEYLRTDGAGREFLKIDAGGSILPPSEETVAKRQHFVFQEGQSVFKFAVTRMADAAEIVTSRNGLGGDDIQWLVPHQANKRIIDATANRVNLDPDKVMINIHKYGNTTTATIPLLLWDYEKQLKAGDNLILAAFGGGFTWGAIYLKWAYTL